MEDDKKVWKIFTKDIVPLNKKTIDKSDSFIAKDEILSPLEILDDQLKNNIQEHNNENPDRLDLHGCTLDRAYELTQSFLFRSFERGIRYVTVITGRSSGEFSISREFPDWVLAGKCRDIVVEVYAVRSEKIPGAYTIQLKTNQQCQ